MMRLAETYREAVNSFVDGYVPLLSRESLMDLKSIKEERCYVYLMMDTVNGFFKIGISVDPSYRERTLQSEKPTIELIASKSYVNRSIATAIEKGLHEAFIQKRLSGEWFERSDKDLKDIISTLSV